MLSVQPWFRGDEKYARDDATKELRSKPPGTFVVRVSRSEPGHYAISAVRPKGSIVSMLILPSYAGPESIAPGRTQYRLGTHSRDLFNTVPKLLMYYTGKNQASALSPRRPLAWFAREPLCSRLSAGLVGALLSGPEAALA